MFLFLSNGLTISITPKTDKSCLIWNPLYDCCELHEDIKTFSRQRLNLNRVLFLVHVVRAAPLRQGYLHYWCDEQIMALLSKMLLQWPKMAYLKPNFAYIGHAAHNRQTSFVMLAFVKNHEKSLRMNTVHGRLK